MQTQNRDVIGLDIAKTIFHAHVAASDGKTGESRRLRRKELLDWAASCEPALIGMEACATSQHWARELTALGHDVKLMPARYVKPYIKRGKSDAIDATGIAEAVTRPTKRFVPAKSKEQQAALMLHRTRALLVRQRTALANALRNYFAEFGIVVPTGIAKLADLISTGAEEIGKSIPEAARCCFAVLVNSYEGVTGNLRAVERQIKEWHLRNDRSQRLSTIPGIGPITASAIAATITDAGAFRSGRDMAAWIGLVPASDRHGRQDAPRPHQQTGGPDAAQTAGSGCDRLGALCPDHDAANLPSGWTAMLDPRLARAPAGAAGDDHDRQQAGEDSLGGPVDWRSLSGRPSPKGICHGLMAA